MTSRGTQRTKTSGKSCTERRRRTARRRQSSRALALEPLESRQLLSAVPMNLDLLTERAFALSQETYQPVVVPPVEILDYPADYQLESIGLVFQEKDAIRTANFLDQNGVFVKPQVRGSNNKMSMRIFVDENRDGWFDERFYEDAQADYSDPIIQPPIDPADIPPAGRVISQLSVGAPQPNQGFPQFLTIGAEGYGRFNAYTPQTVGSSFRVAASNIFAMNGQSEEFPFFREMYATIVDAQRVRLLGLVDSEDFTGAVSITVSPGLQTVLDVDATWFPRRELVAGGHEATAFLAYSSLFWKDEWDTPWDASDEAHDIDRLVVGLDTNTDGLADRVVTSRMALPRQAGEVTVTDFEQLYGGQPVFASLDNRDRDPAHFQAYETADYATRASYAFEILHSDVAVGLRLYEQHTASEYHDNIAVAARVLEDLPPATTVNDGIRVVSRHYAFFPSDSDADGLTDLVAGILGEQPVQQIEHVRVAATLEVPAQFATIGAAIEAARPGDTIQVAAGTYVENLDISKNGLRIVGAGAGLSILTAPAGSDAPAVRFRSVDRSTLLTGFSIQGGYATLSCEGGGIDIDNASPVIRSNEITGNSSRAVGGGIAVRGSSANPLIQDNEIHHNHTRVCHQGFCEDPAAFAGLGGGIYLGDGATGEILGNDIHHNAAWGAGGGIYSGELWAGSFRLLAGGGASVIRNNTIAANTADWDGGVVIENLQGAVPLVLENNLITANVGTYAGGSGIRITESNVQVINNTIVGNRGSNQPGYGINASGSAPVEIRNNILVENDEYGICAPPDAVLAYNDVYGHTVADYCVGTVPGNGSISVDPWFVAPESGDFHLQPDSPARDAGDPAPEYHDTDGSRNDLGVFGGPHPLGEATPDVQPPHVTNVTSSAADGTYGPGASIPISLTFDEPVVVTGQPVLTLETGATKRLASCAAGQPAETLICQYTVLAGDASSDLDYAGATALALAGGSIRDLAGNAAVLTLPIPGTPGSLAANKDLVIDTIVEDYGDAPEPYPTTLLGGGARHVAVGPRLGAARDVEANGQPSVQADGDDADSMPDDEDGVVFGTIRVGQLQASVTVDVRAAPDGARLDAWIDFDGDGTWNGPGERIGDQLLLAEGLQTIRFAVPADARPGTTHARFRLSSAGVSGPGGWAADGEVEDHQVQIQPAPVRLTVTDVRSFPSGFAVDFSTPFAPAVLNLTDQQSGTLGPPDITLVGAVVGEICGSVVLDADAQGFTFVKTGGPLEADTYTVRLRSAANGFVTESGELLDGDGDGAPGGDYVGTFAVVAPTAGTRTVSVGDFLRGPGQSVNLPASTTAGIPLTISDGTGVRAIDMRLTYDPALLQITGATTSVSGGAVQVNTTNPGEVIVVFYSTAPLAAGEVAFVNLQAEVPVANADAIYGAKHVLDLHSVIVSDGDDNEFPTRVDDGIHIVAYPADVSGNGRVNASDAALVARVAALLDDGFVQFRLADPVLVGDVSVNGRINSSDASLVARFAALMSVPEIPPVPAGVVTSPTTAGPDPTLSIPTDLTAVPGESLTVPLQISAAEPLAAPHRLAAANVVILFDKDVLAAEAVTAAGVTTQEGWSLVSNIDNTLGRIVIVAYTTHPVGGTFSDLLANLQFTVHAAASTGTTPLNIAASSGGALTELLDESDGNLTLIPAPTDGASDADVDGLLTIQAPAVPMWHNAVLPWDVNGDGTVTPLDVLIVINYLNSHPGDDTLPALPVEPPQYYDVDNDGRSTAADALSVVNYLNADAAQTIAAESPFSRQTADTSDVWLIDDELIDVLAEAFAPLPLAEPAAFLPEGP
jgi:hypothetical protein